MHGHNLVAIYPSKTEAETVKSKLISEGIPANSIRISDDGPITTQISSRQEEPGFFGWLFGEAPDEDRDRYTTHLRENRAIVSVHVIEKERHLRALDIMADAHPIKLDDKTGDVGMAPQGGTQSGREGDQVIPVVKEELAVGKRQTERHTRIRVYTVERPVEEQVTLRDERVIVERRPATGTAAAGKPQQRTIDVVERHESAVAEKRGRVAEEVVVRKEVTERPETVRGTVQETRVEVEKEPADSAPPKRS